MRIKLNDEDFNYMANLWARNTLVDENPHISAEVEDGAVYITIGEPKEEPVVEKTGSNGYAENAEDFSESKAIS